MPNFASGRRPLSPGSRAGLGAALVLLAVVSAVELRRRPTRPTSSACSRRCRSWPRCSPSGATVLVVGVLATVVGTDLRRHGRPAIGIAGMVNVLGIVLATGIAAAVATIRQRQADRIAELLRLAAVAQQAVLRPLGPQVGSLAVAGRYISATAAADIGGDLYEALDTPYGVRIIIGDVRGKGLDAVRLASIVLGSYRHVAYERADLRAIVTDLDRAVARSVGDEDFVTAALVEERGGTLTIVNCGHPAPLLLRRGRGDRAGPAGAGAAARVHAGGAAAGGAARAGRPAAALHRRPGRGAARRRVLPDRRPGLAPARARHGRRRPGVPGDRPGRLGARPSRRRHRAGAAGVRRRRTTRPTVPMPSWEVGAAGS